VSVLTLHVVYQLYEYAIYNIQNVQSSSLTSVVYHHIESLYSSIGARYVTAEVSCCSTLRVAVEIYYSRRRPSIVVW